MLHVAGKRLSSADPANRMISNDEIGIGGALRTSSSYNKNFRDEFCFQAKVEEGHGAYSPTLWKNNNSYEFSPLLPCDHQYSNLSTRTRLQTIVEARKELMEMIRDMPESSYELSLKDIVDKHQQKNLEDDYKEDDDDNNMVPDNKRSFRFETEAQVKKMQKKKKMKRMESVGSNKFSRSSSMDSEIFLIKMFFIPSCFGSKKKNITTHKNGSSKVSPRNSSEIHEDDLHKEPRIKRIFSAGETKHRGKIVSNSSSSNSDSIISTSRLAGKYFSTGCWPFLHKKKSKASEQGGLL